MMPARVSVGPNQQPEPKPDPHPRSGGGVSLIRSGSQVCIRFMHENLDISALLCARPWVGSANVMLGRVSLDLNP